MMLNQGLRVGGIWSLKTPRRRSPSGAAASLRGAAVAGSDRWDNGYVPYASGRAADTEAGLGAVAAAGVTGMNIGDLKVRACTVNSGNPLAKCSPLA